MIQDNGPVRDFKLHRLGGGLRVLLRRDRTLPLASFQVWVACGSVDEAPEEAGISHFLEHMVFKANPGTADLARLIESRGGTINAATQHELTHYYADLPSDGLELAARALGNSIANLWLGEEDVEKERRVILEEMSRRDDSPSTVLWDRFLESAFSGTRYGRPVIGTRSTVGRVGRSVLARYHRSHYTASRIVVTCAGDFSPDRLLKTIESAFKTLPGNRPGKSAPKLRLRTGPLRPLVMTRPVRQGYLACGFHTPGLSSPDLVSLDLTADVLGGGISSRLYRRLREERRLLWSIGTNLISYRHSGLLGIFAETPPERLGLSLEAIREELKRLGEEPATLEEIARAKARIRSEWIAELETLHGQAAVIGHLAALGLERLAHTYLSDLERIRPADIQATWSVLLKDQPMAVAMLKPQAS